MNSRDGLDGGARSSMPAVEPPFIPGIMIVCALLGMLAGLLGSFLHLYTWAGIYTGALLALLILAVVCVASGWSAGSRRGALAAATGWLVTVYLLWAWTRPEGDFLFLTAWVSKLWLYGGAIVAIAACGLPYELFGYRALVARGTLPDPSDYTLAGDSSHQPPAPIVRR